VRIKPATLTKVLRGNPNNVTFDIFFSQPPPERNSVSNRTLKGRTMQSLGEMPCVAGRLR
jgi:hypothetical protein